jgi:prepilin-type processing-associated H-X9-DG protein
MLVVIAIIALLATILVPAATGALRSAKRIKCASNLRQVGNAIFMFAGENKGFLPAMRHGGWNGNDSDIPDGPPTGDQWSETISKYLGDQTDAIHEDDIAAITRGCPAWKGRTDISSEATRRTKPGYGMNPYPGAGSDVPNENGDVTRAGPLMKSHRALAVDDLDSPSNTILVGDSVDWHLSLTGWWPNGEWWTTDSNEYGYYSAHPDRHGKNANYLMADGSVSALTPNVARAHLRDPTQIELD